MDGWVNVDSDPNAKVDIHCDALEFVRQYSAEIEEVYLGHVIEHMLPGHARALLAMLCSRLRPGAMVSVVVPDMSAIFEAYHRGEISNDELNEKYVYSYVQPSHHLWCYDEGSLRDLLAQAGFGEIESLDPLSWDPVYWKEGPESRWQCGVRARAVGDHASQDDASWTDYEEPAPVGRSADPDGAASPPMTVEAMLLKRLSGIRRVLIDETRRRRELEAMAGDAESAARLAHAALNAGSLKSTSMAALRANLRVVASQMLPVGSRSRWAVSASLQTYREIREARGRILSAWARQGLARVVPVSYRSWSRSHDASSRDIGNQVLEWRRRRDPMKVRCFVADRGDEALLNSTLRSLAEQSWGTWEALVLSVAGQASAISARLSRDERIRCQVVAGDDPWAELDSVVAPVGPRDFVVFLEAGDELSADCFFQVACHDRRDPAIDLVHWDDDVIGPDGGRHSPRFRPEWSPDMLLSANYLGRSFAIRQARYVLADGIRPERGSARFWDVLLRSQLDAGRVSRITRVLAHLVNRDDSVGEHGAAVVGDFLASKGLTATTEASRNGVKVTWDLGPQPPRVSIVVPTRHNRPMVGRCLESLAATDYPGFDVTVVDNGPRTADNEAWYEQFSGLGLTVHWWDQPFNYSAVNNMGASTTQGDILVFLNDDTEVLDNTWLRELVGWARQPDIGVVGMRLLDAEGNIQHAGVTLGMNGFADHPFQGLPPVSPTLLGPTTWCRNTLAVTGACLALRRDLFEEVGGFDERFILCGSDVALGLDVHLLGHRNVCSALPGIRHFESVTRGTDIPRQDFFASYWRYQHWIFGGDPYFSPNLSLSSRVPRLRSPYDPSPADRLSDTLGRRFEVFRQRSDQGEAFMLADTCRATAADVGAVRSLHRTNSAAFEVKTVNWFLPDIDSPFYGGVNTAFRIADQLARDHGVENRFVVIGGGPEEFFRSALAAAFPRLAGCPATICDGSLRALEALPAADAAIATLWTTAYAVARFPHVRRKFYLIQDFEPMFYPAGTLYALAEESYRLGLYGLTNTDNLLRIYRDDYAGAGTSFMPAVDPAVFHARGRGVPVPDAPATLFVYARPGHWRNCWELAGPALEQVKNRLGDRVRIVTAGSWAVPEAQGLPSMRHLGLLDYRATGDLYRQCDIGLSLTVSKHPSYLPLELMACGVPVVAFDNPWGHWILRDGENSLLALRTVDGLSDCIERLVVDVDLRQRLGMNAMADIERSHSSWDAALGGIHGYLCDPEG